MNLTQLQTQLQAFGYGTETTAQQTAFLNDAYRTICGGDRWPFLEKQNNVLTVVPPSNVVDLSTITDLAELDSVRIAIPSDQTQFYNITNIEPQPMRDLEHGDQEAAVPSHWSIVANKLHLWPFPDQAYTMYIDYIFIPADLAAGTDVPVIPVIYHDVIVWGAVKMMAQRERDIYSANMAEQVYEEKLKSFKEAYQLRQRQNSSTVKDSGYWGNTRQPLAGAR